MEGIGCKIKKEKNDEDRGDIRLDLYFKDEKIGFATLTNYDGCMNLTFLEIEEKYQKRGIGKMITDEITKHAKTKKKNLVVSALPKNYGFFEKCGFPYLSDTI